MFKEQFEDEITAIEVENGSDAATVTSDHSNESSKSVESGDVKENPDDYVSKQIINSKKNCCFVSKVISVDAVCLLLVAISCFAIIGIVVPKFFLTHEWKNESTEILPSNIGIIDNSMMDKSIPFNTDNINNIDNDNSAKDNSTNENTLSDPLDVEKIILRIASVLGSDASTLVGSESAESMALQWILKTDEMGLTSESPNLIQRFIMVYFYYHTSSLGSKQWLSCGQKNTTINNSRWSTCTYNEFVGHHFFTEEDDDQYQKIRATRWLTPNKSECIWAGISCSDDADGNKVITGLDLTGQNYGGSFPEQLLKVSTLESLNLSYNKLTGTVPKDILSKLPSLNLLYLNDNSFTGGIPPEWLFDEDNKKLKYDNMKDLNIGGITNSQMGNMLVKNFAMAMPNLVTFRISNTQYTGTIPKEMFELENLNSFDFRDNPMNGNIPSEIGLATKLRSIRLGGTELTGALPSEIGNLEKLQIFDVGRSDSDKKGSLTGLIPVEIYNKCTQLWRIDLSDNEFSGTIPASIKSILGLSKFDIRSNKFSGSIPPQMGSLSSLNQMYVQGNVPGITGTLPDELCAMRRPEDGKQGGFTTLEADCNICPADDDCCSKCCDTQTNLCYNKRSDRVG